MNDYFDIENDHDEIMLLEPRLMEYIGKKKFYKENDIQPAVPLETEYQITKNDISNPRFIRGNAGKTKRRRKKV